MRWFEREKVRGMGEDEGLFGEMEEREAVVNFVQAHVSADGNNGVKKKRSCVFLLAFGESLSAAGL